MKTTTLLGLGLAMIFASCEKETVKPAGTASRLSASMRLQENPYEHVGIAHNRAMDAIAADARFPGHSMDEVFGIVSSTPVRLDMLSEETVRFDQKNILQLYTNMKPDLELIIANRDNRQVMLNIPASLYNRGEITYKQKDLIDHLLNTVVTSPDLNSVERRVRTFENMVIQRQDVSEPEKHLVLVCAAIARHSSKYADEAAKDPSGPWHGAFDNESQPARRNPWVVVGDILGGLVGGAIGGTLTGGSLFGIGLGGFLGSGVVSGVLAEFLL